MWRIFNYSVTLLSDQPATLETVKELALWYFLSRGNTFTFTYCEHIVQVSSSKIVSMNSWWHCFLMLLSHPTDWTPLLLDLMKKSFLPCLVTSIHPPSLSITPACRPALHTLDCCKQMHFIYIKGIFLPGSPPVSCSKALEETSS